MISFLPFHIFSPYFFQFFNPEFSVVVHWCVSMRQRKKRQRTRRPETGGGIIIGTWCDETRDDGRRLIRMTTACWVWKSSRISSIQKSRSTWRISLLMCVGSHFCNPWTLNCQGPAAFIRGGGKGRIKQKKGPEGEGEDQTKIGTRGEGRGGSNKKRDQRGGKERTKQKEGREGREGEDQTKRGTRGEGRGGPNKKTKSGTRGEGRRGSNKKRNQRVKGRTKQKEGPEGREGEDQTKRWTRGEGREGPNKKRDQRGGKGRIKQKEGPEGREGED